MQSEFQVFIDKCIKAIQDAYEASPTLDEAEKLAALFLDAQLRVGTELKSADLDARMRKSGLKAIKAAVYLEEASRGDKKPTEATLTAKIDSSELVIQEQQALDNAEVYRDELQNYLSVFRDGHIYFRGMAKGRFE